MGLRETSKKPFRNFKRALKNFGPDFKRSFKKARQDPKKAWKSIGREFIKFWTKKRIYFVASGVAVYLLAPLLVFILELRQRLYDWDATWAFVTKHPEIFHYTCLIMLLISLIFVAIFKSVVRGEAVLLATIIAITFAHINKYKSRDFPLLPEDLQMATEAGALTKMINIWELALTIAIIVALIFGANILQKFINRKVGLKRKSKKFATFRLMLGLVSALILISTVAPIKSINDRRTYVKFLDTEIVAWDQVENYSRNGFLVGFIYNIGSKKMEKPSFTDYNEATIKKIVDKYKKLAKTNNVGKLSLEDEDINVLYVMNESFSDPNRFKETYPFTGENPVPNLNKLQDNAHTASGTIQGSEYGGGTANVEFEALTGMSNYFLGVVPYVQIMSKKPNFPSLPSFLNSQGYTSTGLHPFSGNMYKRSIVYKNLGFKTFLDKDGFTYTTPEPNTNKYISDASAYKQALKQLSEPGKQFVTLITMQNHMPYSNIYENHDFSSTAEGIDESTNAAIDNYLQTLHSADTALGDLVKELDKLDKKTVLVFWGDHLPGLYGKLDGTDQKYQTPLVIYANFATGSDLGTLSSNYIPLELLNYLNAQKPAYYYLLDATKESVPILAKSYFNDSAPEETEALEDYEMIEYDMLSGKKYSQKLGLFDL